MNVKIHIGGNQKSDSDAVSQMFSDYDENFHNTIWPNARSNYDSAFKVFSATPSVTVENIQDIINEDNEHHFRRRI
jgi:hypothetical protein